MVDCLLDTSHSLYSKNSIEELPDQYANGKAASVWEMYIGNAHERTANYRKWFMNLLKPYGCQNVLDVACGTGVDSIMFNEEGFDVVSTDGSDKMLKYALKYRWDHRHVTKFDTWVIEEANWLTLPQDLYHLKKPDGGYDALICLGNSFAHMPDMTGDLNNQKCALNNFWSMIKPGGLMIIDHRNYDAILNYGKVVTNNVYYSSSNIANIHCSNLYVNGKAIQITLDYLMNYPDQYEHSPITKFSLSYYPHRLEAFSGLIKEMFGGKSDHVVFGDFLPLGEIENPAYYIHVVRKY